jgi:alpha-D-ribose 1-methylphosphonate 5-triphosphate diphosphatase PhnM
MPTEPQQTRMDNQYYDLVSVLYHTLLSAQTLADYIQDAQQAGNQELAQFFQEIKQQQDQWAEQAKQLLAKLTSPSGVR